MSAPVCSNTKTHFLGEGVSLNKTKMSSQNNTQFNIMVTVRGFQKKTRICFYLHISSIRSDNLGRGENSEIAEQSLNCRANILVQLNSTYIFKKPKTFVG